MGAEKTVKQRVRIPLPRRADAVVVGAGAAGLMASLALMRHGCRPVLLEADGRVGGTAGSFLRKGFRFPTGPLGFTVPEEIGTMLAEVGGPGLPRLTREHFTVRLGSEAITMSQPLGMLAGDLGRMFPQDRRGIDRFMEILEDLIQQIRNTRAVAPERVEELLGDVARMPASDVLFPLCHAPRLRSILGSQGGGDPVMPMGLLAGMWDFLAETGIWYPDGGIHRLMNRIADCFVAQGGLLALSTPAARVLVRDNRVAGIETANGQTILTPAVIAAMDTGVLVKDLLPDDETIRDFRRTVLQRSLTGSLLSLSLGIDPAGVDLSAMVTPNLLWTKQTGTPVPWDGRRGEPEEFVHDEIWISRLSELDKTLGPENREVLVIRVDAPYDFFATLRKPVRPHDPDYYRLKERAGTALVQFVSEILPGLSEAVRVFDVATPLTYEFWGHRRRGAVAGWSWDAQQSSGDSFISSPIRGLKIAGILAFPRLWLGGMGSAMKSGIRAGTAVVADTE